jgi:aminopeptidase N
MSSTSNPYRLPRAVAPSAYRIFLIPDLDRASFAGRVEIDVEVLESSDRITLNAADLELSAATLTAGVRSHRSIVVEIEEKFETATFVFAEAIAPGPATIEVAFTGVINDMLVGFYRSSFTDEAGTTHVIATTQLQECEARKVFPCWDEPSYKATFQTTLTVPSHLAAYSNSPVTSNVDLGNGQRTVSFAPTMVMSTYLNVFVVGPFEETAPIDVLGTPLRIVHPIGKGHLTSFALEASAFSLKFFSEYFDIAYPGDKLDHVAIPDFAFGAMENLGCVTYREADLLIDPNTASIAELRRVLTVIAHETAHMWFGDLVTMEWWEGIWLNEAFATFMEVLCSDAMRPEWRAWTYLGVEREKALEIDGLHATRPIEFDVVAPADCLVMIDFLTYQKGASVLRMLQQYLGETVFRDAIRTYLRRHMYANTVTTDLWDALEEVSGHPVRDLMTTWILQGGHPLVTFANGTISQAPYAFIPADGPSNIGTTWSVPVLVRSLGDGAAARHLLGEQSLVIDEAAPVLVNAGGSGYYRTAYGPDELASLVARLDDLDELERQTLVADQWGLLRSGHVTWREYYSVASHLNDADDAWTWSGVATAVGWVDRALREDQRGAFGEVVRDLFAPQWARVGFDPRPDDGVLTVHGRSAVLATIATLGGDRATADEAVRRFEADEIPADLATAILRVVGFRGEARHYETALERWHLARTPQDAQRYLGALAHFADHELALRTAELCFSEVRTQDAPNALCTLMSQRGCGEVVWRYVTGRWRDALERFPTYLHPRLMWALPTFITDVPFAAEVENFHLGHPLERQERKMAQQIELMKVGLAFAARIRPQF